jgi:hypothetical protein
MDSRKEIVLENTKDELIVVVDEQNNVVGSKTRKEMVICKKYVLLNLNLIFIN